MEFSSFSSTKSSSSSVLNSPISDQSHLHFYQSRHAFPFPKAPLSARLPPCYSKLAVSSLRAALGTSASVGNTTETAMQQSLTQELAELKLLLKQKKRELKAHKKEEKKGLKSVQVDKKGLKMEAKELNKIKKMEKKAFKDQEKKMKMCSSESSSSGSESSDCECESLSMNVLRQGNIDHRGTESMLHVEGTASTVSRVSSTCTDEPELPFASSITDVGTKVRFSDPLVLSGEDDEKTQVAATSEHCTTYEDSNGCQFGSSSTPSVRTSKRIEVCTGGKCRKAGSQQLLLAFHRHIPAASSVEAVPCKCMGKCGMAINIKVHREDTNPQRHSRVRVEDADLILSHHFCLGRPASGLPVFPPIESSTAPSPVLTL